MKVNTLTNSYLYKYRVYWPKQIFLTDALWNTRPRCRTTSAFIGWVTHKFQFEVEGGDLMSGLERMSSCRCVNTTWWRQKKWHRAFLCNTHRLLQNEKIVHPLDHTSSKQTNVETFSQTTTWLSILALQMSSNVREEPNIPPRWIKI